MNEAEFFDASGGTTKMVFAPVEPGIKANGTSGYRRYSPLNSRVPLGWHDILITIRTYS